MKKTLIILGLVLLAAVLCGHYVWYGSLMSNCVYTEEDVPVPPDLASGWLVTTRAAFEAHGQDPDYACLPVLGGIARTLVNPQTLANPTVGEKYFVRRGLTIAPVPADREFRVTQILRVTKHGLSTMDSGSGPLYYLILADAPGEKFQMATVTAGINKDDVFLKARLIGGKTYPVDYRAFKDVSGQFGFSPAP